MKMTIDFTNAKEQGNYLPAGKHTVKINKLEAKETQSGYPQIHISFIDAESREFTHYQSADFEKDWVRSWWYNFTKNAGLPVTKTNFSFDTNDLINKPMFIDVKREYNDYSDKYVNRLKYTAKYEKEKADQWNEEYEISAEEKAHKAKSDNGTSNANNPFASATGPLDMSSDEMPF